MIRIFCGGTRAFGVLERLNGIDANLHAAVTSHSEFGAMLLSIGVSSLGIILVVQLAAILGHVLFKCGQGTIHMLHSVMNHDETIPCKRLYPGKGFPG